MYIDIGMLPLCNFSYFFDIIILYRLYTKYLFRPNINKILKKRMELHVILKQVESIEMKQRHTIRFLLFQRDKCVETKKRILLNK